MLDYRVPPEIGDLTAGTRVLIPIGPRRHTGVVVGATDGLPRDKLRDVIAVLDQEPVLGGSLLRLVEWR